MRLIFWVLFAFMLGVYLTMAIWSLPGITADAGGLVPFDIRPTGYTYVEAQTFIAALSEDGRDFYLNVQHNLDSAYPALMAVVLVMAFRPLFRGGLRVAAIVLALAGAGFDYMENAAVAVMLRAGDNLSEAMVATASRWTVLKSAAVTLALLMLIAGLGVAWLNKRRAKAQP